MIRVVKRPFRRVMKALTRKERDKMETHGQDLLELIAILAKALGTIEDTSAMIRKELAIFVERKERDSEPEQ